MLHCCVTGAAESAAAPGKIVVRCQVVAKQEANLSPREVGILDMIVGSEGRNTTVDRGQIVLQLEDTKAQQELSVAKAKAEAAKIKADDNINEIYAAAAAGYAKKELEFNQKANRDVPGSVPQAKIDELELKCKETSLAIDKARHERAVAEKEAAVAYAEVKAAETMIDLLTVKAPFDGEVFEVKAHKGEAVQPSQPVIHIVHVDTLWVEGSVSGFARSELEGQPVKVEVDIPHTPKFKADGKIIFESSMTDPSGFTVRAEIQRQNRDDPWPVRPGMTGQMTIEVKAAEAK